MFPSLTSFSSSCFILIHPLQEMLSGNVETIMKRMKELSEAEEPEDSQEEKMKKFEKVEKQNVECRWIAIPFEMYTPTYGRCGCLT